MWRRMREGGSQQKSMASQKASDTVFPGRWRGQVRVARRSRTARAEGDLRHSETWKSLDEQPLLWNDERGSQIGVG